MCNLLINPVYVCYPYEMQYNTILVFVAGNKAFKTRVLTVENKVELCGCLLLLCTGFPLGQGIQVDTDLILKWVIGCYDGLELVLISHFSILFSILFCFVFTGPEK